MTVAKESSPLLTGDSNGTIMGLEGNTTEYKSSSMRSFSSKMMKSLSSVDRHHALKNLGVGPAAFLIRDAVLGFQDAPFEGYYDPYSTADTNDPEKILKNAISFVCGRLIAYNWVTRFLYGANWILFILSFVEPPQWCRDSNLQIAQNNLSDDLDQYGDCQVILGGKGTAADGEENQDYYPNFGTMLLTISQSKHIELICIFTIFLYLVLKLGDDGMDFRLFFYPGTKRRMHSLRLITLACLLTGVLVDNTVLNHFSAC